MAYLNVEIKEKKETKRAFQSCTAKQSVFVV
jgi:hypothetical protein